MIGDVALPDYINTYFTDIGSNLASGFNEDLTDNIPNFDGVEMTNILVYVEMLEKLVRDVDSHKSSSIPNLTTKVLKDAF